MYAKFEDVYYYVKYQRKTEDMSWHGGYDVILSFYIKSEWKLF